MQKKVDETKVKMNYTKPLVLAATKKGSNFSAGCQSKTGLPCYVCRCS